MQPAPEDGRSGSIPCRACHKQDDHFRFHQPGHQQQYTEYPVDDPEGRPVYLAEMEFFAGKFWQAVQFVGQFPKPRILGAGADFGQLFKRYAQLLTGVRCLDRRHVEQEIFLHLFHLV